MHSPVKDSTASKDTVLIASAKAATDSLMQAKMKASRDSAEKALLARAIYPLIKTGKWSGVIPVANIDEKPDVTQRYNLLMEITTPVKDTSEAKEINAAVAEIGRLINIHIAAGIPQKNITVVVVAHRGVLRSFYTDSAYKAKYKMPNPNIVAFNELLAAGVKFIACGQAMAFLSIDRKMLLPWVKVALSAQSELTSYQLKGYVLKTIDTDK